MRAEMPINVYDIGGAQGAARRFSRRLAAARESFFGKAFEQVFILSAAHALSGFLVLGTFILLANKLGPRLYGEFTFADSVVFIGVLCASLGTEYVGNREVARNEDSSELVSGILILRTVASIAAFAVLLAWSLIFVESGSLRALMLIAGGVLLSVPGIAGWFFLARRRVGIVALVTLIRELAFFAPVLFILDLIDDPEKRLLYAAVFYLLSKVAFALIFLLRLIMETGFTFKVKAATYRYILKDSLALLYASLVASVMISVQIYMLKLLNEEVALGVYGAIFKQIFYIQLLSLSFIMVFFPLLSKAWVEDRNRYEKLSSALSELTLVVVLPVALTGVLYPDYLLSVFFTEEYSTGALTLQLLSFSLIPMSYVRVLTTGILISMDMTAKMYSLVNISFAGSIVSCLLIFAFPSADAGAAASRLASECLFAAASYAVVARRVRVLSPGVLKCVLPGAAAMVLVRALLNGRYALAGIAISYASFFAVYLLALYRTRMEEMKELLSGNGLSAGRVSHEQILIGREER
jgi:O-antigen/teichoic acid export membrane protein